MPAISAKLTTHGGQERRWREDGRRRRRELAAVAGHDRGRPCYSGGLVQDTVLEVVEARIERGDQNGTLHSR